MDSVFENQYTHTPQVEKELYAQMLFRRPFYIVLLSLLAACMVLSVILGCIGGFSMMNIFAIIFGCIVFAVFFLRYVTLVKSAEKRYEELKSARSFECKSVMYEASVASASADRDAPTELPLTKIVKVFETKHYYYLMTEARLSFVFEKGGFVKGNEADFLPFVRERVHKK
ncbi:MAG: YcxB family protein [Ruminococcus sp.]|nr:YcxB family protein [Ruminococcus sp.]